MQEMMKLAAVGVTVLSLAACGGGTGAGSGSTGGPASPGTYARANPTAEDPRDRWNDPRGLRAALGLSPVTDPASQAAAINALHRTTGNRTIGTRTLLDRVESEGIEVLGERDGIVYGQWKGGPAGTINIEFDWRFAPNVDAQSRALMERAGKAWSRRLTDDLGIHTVPAGTEISIGDIERTLHRVVTTDGIVIFVFDKGPSTDNFSSAGPSRLDFDTDGVEPRAGKILLNRKHHDSRRVMMHEIGHVLGIGSSNHPAIVRYVDRQNHAFTGPKAVSANGGRSVPYQWVNADGREVAPGTSGAMVDYGHPAVCTSVMAYCSRNRVTDPSALDFAILDDIGYDLLDEATASQPELYGYGAWARYTAWGAGVERVLDPGADRLGAGAHAFGVEPATGLADNRALSGSAVWTGSLLGVDIGDAALPPVFGNARLQVVLATLVGSARFDNLTVSRGGGATGAFRSPSLEYEGTIVGNTFSDEQKRVSARFFGPAHEEMAGIVNDPDAGLLAGFGGKR